MDYQPIVSWSRKTTIGYEALVRSSDTLLSDPSALLDAAEELRRVHDLGRQIRNTCAAQFEFNREPWSLYINLHPYDLLDKALFDRESSVLTIAPQVVLELTERGPLEAVDQLHARVEYLRYLGFRIAVDFVARGYSGFTKYETMQPDVVKLDMCLVRGIEGDPVKRKLVRRVNDLCGDVGILVIAEGVETPSERDTLVSLGCDVFQGFLFARPGPPFPRPKFGELDSP